MRGQARLASCRAVCWNHICSGEALRRGGRVDVQELIEALDQRIVDAIAAKATGETIVRLCEARAWLTNPGQPHMTGPASGT